MGFTDKFKAMFEKNRQEELQVPQDGRSMKVVVAMDVCGISSGARATLNTFLECAKDRPLDHVTITQGKCIGKCDFEPIVQVFGPDRASYCYGHVDQAVARRIYEEHLVNGTPVSEYLV